MSIKNVLVPLDGSQLAERALPYAVKLAQPGGSMTLLRAVPAVPEVVDMAQSDEMAENRRAPEESVPLAQEELGRTKERLEAAGVAASYRVLYDDPAAAIMRAAEQGGHLVVMSTHGRSGIGRWVYGSVADRVLRESRVPVVLIPAACQQPWRDGQRGTVVLALDGSEFAEAAIEPAVDLARAIGGHITLVQAIEPPSFAWGSMIGGYPPPQFDVDPLMQAAEDYLRQVAERLRGQVDVDITARLGSPLLVIAEVARERSAGAVALASHGRGGLGRLILGSVATGIIHTSLVPVLVVRPRLVEMARQQVESAGVERGLAVS